MKYIIGRNEGEWGEQWHIDIMKSYEQWGAMAEIKDEEITKVRQNEYWAEPDFEIKFKEIPEEIKNIKFKTDKNILLVTIGSYLDISNITHYYEVQEKKWERTKNSQVKVPWICCFSREERIPVSSYLDCIDLLHHIAEELQLKLVIVGHITSSLPYFKYRSLADRIINNYMKKYKSIYIQHAEQEDIPYYYEISKRAYEPYSNLIQYGCLSVRMLERKLAKEDIAQVQETSRQTERMLYQDNFYEEIPPNQKIYVPLNLFNNRNCSYYNDLGINTVCIGTHYTLLYDEKQKIDSTSNQIRSQVVPTYLPAIYSPAPIKKESIGDLVQYQQLNGSLKYRGRGVYIGIIGTQGVDYKQDFLQDADGNTRISYIWEQKDGKEGNLYTAEQINRALKAESTESIVPFESGENNETLILEMAAGKNNSYEGFATEAQFIVAKIKSAPASISRIYGGIAREESVLMADILVGISKMVQLAQTDNKPLVIYIPYNTNIAAHDGTNIYEIVLEEFAMQQGISIIVPSGEEGDKSHHAELKPSTTQREQVTFQVRSNVERVVGIIYMHSMQKQPFSLFSPNQGSSSVRIDEKGVSSLGDATIYSAGIQDDYQNGSRYILFSINKMTRGDWQLLWEKQSSITGHIDLWLTQEPLNPYVRLKPSSPFTTLGSNATVDAVMSVAAFNLNYLVVAGSSGRGFAWNGTIKPLCASESENIIVYQKEWSKVSGTAIAASVLLGTIAMLYEKWHEENDEPYANSLIMNNLILSNLTQFLGENYPNKGQGYGVFEIRHIPQILATSIIRQGGAYD